MKHSTNFRHYTPPQLILGTWQVSAGHHVQHGSPDTQTDTFFKLVEDGTRCFDCADIYSGAEELLGQTIERVEQQLGKDVAGNIRIHTKFVPDLDQLANVDHAYVTRIIDRSLIRLKREALDLVQFHWWDFSTERFVEVAGYLKELRDAGKILNIGVTNFDTAHLAQLIDAGIPIVSDQVQFSLLDRRPLKFLTEYAMRNNIALLCYGTLAGGYFGERFVDLSEEEGAPANRSQTKYRLIIEECGGWEKFQELLKLLDSIARSKNISIADLVTRLMLDEAAVTSVIVGARTSQTTSSLPNPHSISLTEADTASVKDLLQTLKAVPGEVYELERDPDGIHRKIMRFNLNDAKP